MADGTGIHIGIDVGGTFTDVAVSIPGENRVLLHKLASTPDRPDRAIIEGIRQVLARHRLDAGRVRRLSHGTTVGTNALIERKVGRVAVVTGEGFRDLIEIGRQTRPKVYDIHLDHPKPLVPRELRLEVPERVLADGTVRTPLDEARLAEAARALQAAEVDCVVVCFLNSYAFPAHEERAVAILKAVLPGHVHVVASSGLHAEFREYERFSTAVLNGALLTVMNDYLDRFTRESAALGVPVEPDVSQSAGGFMSIAMARQAPIRASLSGPAAGVTGASARALAAGFGDVITLDMGGTSADVSLLVGGRAAEVVNRMLAGFPLRLPALDVNAVGAGGGSIAWIDRDGLLKVGPRSAGAQPGPACYGLGGEDATVTDANVVLGRLSGESLLDGAMPIKKELAERAVGRLAGRLGLGLDETALGIIRVTCAVMVKAIRTISVERGHDPKAFSLFAFGGAGPLHAAEVARQLDIGRILVPASPGILCAEGLLQSDLRGDFVRTVLLPLEAAHAGAFEDVRRAVAALVDAWFADEGVAPDRRRLEWAADMRYRGQNFELSVPLAGRVPGLDPGITADAIPALVEAFHAAHDTAYGFASPGETIEFVNVRAKAVGVTDKPANPTLDRVEPAAPAGSRRVLCGAGGWRETPVWRRAALARGQRLAGPAVIEQLDTTVLLFPGDAGRVDDRGNLIVDVGED